MKQEEKQDRGKPANTRSLVDVLSSLQELPFVLQRIELLFQELLRAVQERREK